MSRSRSTSVALLIATLAGPARVHAQASPRAAAAGPDDDAARTAFQQGLLLFDRGDFEGALTQFTRAYELSHRAVVLFNLGATLQALHRYPEAIDALRRFVAETPSDTAQRGDARRALDDMLRLVARVQLALSPSDAEVSLDEQSPLRDRAVVLLRPGTHGYTARRAGFATAQGSITVHVGEQRTLQIALRRDSFALRDASVLPARLLVAGVSTDARVRAGALEQAASVPLELPPGTHALWINAPGRTPWQGSVTLVSGSTRTLRVQLARERTGLAPGYFAVAAGLTGALSASGLATGLATVRTADEFASLTRSDPMALTLAAQGRSLALATDVLFGCAIGSLIATVVLATRTEFTTGVSTAELARVRFFPGGVAF